ncbi:MAG: SprT family zinc-dependent metalloprotease [Pseudomonadota bacterium]|nr:SprT family zinc-dependent metalloprotease [Pseudomonadota bacterium]
MPKVRLEYPTMPFEYEVLRSKRKTLAIHIRGGKVTINSPLRASVEWISEFVKDSAPWVQGKIRDQLTKQKEVLVLADGRDVPFLGKRRRMRVKLAPRGKVELSDDEVLVLAPSADKVERVFGAWLLEQAREYMVTQSIKTAKALGLEQRLKDVVFRRTRSKWGHCEDNGVIQYNPLVMMAPRAVIDYLIVHEVSHLRHLDHSPRFWKQVAVLCPDYKTHRDWLNTNGHKLWTS